MPETPLPASSGTRMMAIPPLRMSLQCHETEADAEAPSGDDGDRPPPSSLAARRRWHAVLAGRVAPVGAAQPAAAKMRIGMIGAGRIGGTIGGALGQAPAIR